ncbi:ABC transporter permease [Hymenobacter jejuensis]|uniref:FtsX-like permease family protein n=1 Tax=Hymenobacter jejuensis TaxID=2502781 RepID=A0A5B7ZV58_9BACT|nr:ABC transporter permease [Hymenobacter jejuensis]QDA58727.1 FtsX-like permease family protein [Hymenobacter jejuensis]
MFRNYIKIAFRNLWRNKAFAAINISGLALGIATCLIIMLFVRNELSYDRYNEKADRMVRVVFRGSVQGEKMKESSVMPPVARTLLAEYPEVEQATRLSLGGAPRITYGDKSFKERDIAMVDSNFFQVFTIPLLQGDPKTALVQPNSIVISRATAQKYFGKANPMGKVLTFKDWNKTYKVTGVFDKVPINSHFHFDIFASLASVPDAKSSSWMTSNYFTYLVLPEGYEYKKLEAKLPQIVEKYLGPQLQQAMGMSFTQFRQKGNDLGLFLQPLTDIHLRSDFTNNLEPGGDVRYVYIFGAIAVFMLLIACINFMNLSTAGASRRAREVGVRKVLGSVKSQLVGQFLLESILLTMIALVLALVLIAMALPIFNELAGKELGLDFTTDPWLVPGLLLFGVLVGVLAGSYPAFFLSSFNPVAVLKGKFTSGKGSIGLRSGLVVFQFCISIALIISTTVVYQQLHYIQNKKLGYDKDHVLVLPETWVLGKHAEAFRQLLLQDPRVVSVSTSGYLPAGPSFSNNFFVSTDDNPSQLTKTLRYEVDPQYIPTLGIRLAAGRNFSKAFSTDTAAVILNEMAARTFGWGKNALGHTLSRSDNQGKKRTFRVIGVIRDFHFKSLHEPISPLLMTLGDNSGSVIAKVKTQDIAGLLASLKLQWSKFSPEEPFSYSFMDERFMQTYEAERKIGRILYLFAGLTIFVACLGLFGLATFTAEQRTKEIGIRKVLGASVTNIVGLLSCDFLRLVLIANLVAWPLAWWAMTKWLQDFAYRVSIGWWVFALAGVAALLIALLTVSVQAMRAAIANPVKSLRAG